MSEMRVRSRRLGERLTGEEGRKGGREEERRRGGEEERRRGGREIGVCGAAWCSVCRYAVIAGMGKDW